MSQILKLDVNMVLIMVLKLINSSYISCDSNQKATSAESQHSPCLWVQVYESCFDKLSNYKTSGHFCSIIWLLSGHDY